MLSLSFVVLMFFKLQIEYSFLIFKQQAHHYGHEACNYLLMR